MTTEDLEKPKINISAGFWRRILALFYDSLLLIGIIIGFLLIITFLFDKSFETPFERLFLQISYLVIGFLFFTYFWKVNNGQTLGMQVWKIKIVGDSNEDLTIKNLLNSGTNVSILTSQATSNSLSGSSGAVSYTHLTLPTICSV